MDRQTVLVSFFLPKRSGFKVHMACINNWAGTGERYSNMLKPNIGRNLMY